MTYANKQKGEVLIDGPDGNPLKMCMTLGAIAQMEDELGIEGLTEIDEIMSKGSMKPLIKIVKALLAGGGNPISDEAFMTWSVSPRDMVAKIQDCFAAAGFGQEESSDQIDMDLPERPNPVGK